MGAHAQNLMLHLIYASCKLSEEAVRGSGRGGGGRGVGEEDKGSLMDVLGNGIPFKHNDEL